MCTNNLFRIKPSFATRLIRGCAVALLVMSALCFIAAIVTQTTITVKELAAPQETTIAQGEPSTQEAIISQEQIVDKEIITQILKCRTIIYFAWIGCALVLILILAAILYSFRYSWVDMTKADREEEIKVLYKEIEKLKAEPKEGDPSSNPVTEGKAKKRGCLFSRIFCRKM